MKSIEFEKAHENNAKKALINIQAEHEDAILSFSVDNDIPPVHFVLDKQLINIVLNKIIEYSILKLKTKEKSLGELFEESC